MIIPFLKPDFCVFLHVNLMIFPLAFPYRGGAAVASVRRITHQQGNRSQHNTRALSVECSCFPRFLFFFAFSISWILVLFHGRVSTVIKIFLYYLGGSDRGEQCLLFGFPQWLTCCKLNLNFSSMNNRKV